MCGGTSKTVDKPPEHIAQQLLNWFDEHGRHDLPWQQPRTAYRVWVAEVMLQQTQVTTVIGYFERFMARFPDVYTLADAESDAVMHLWAGLGYYARARNLHAAAQQVVEKHDGQMPQSVEQLMALPGIGRSTAGAIRAQAFGLWAPILDGNAKRVIARLAAVRSRPGTAAFENMLWPLAERYTPYERIIDYTQAIMDLGAMVCTRRNPDCPHCPLQSDCLAARHELQADIPAPRRRPQPRLRHATLLQVVDKKGLVLLEKRPPAGIWGGLWSLPQQPENTTTERYCAEQLGVRVQQVTQLQLLRHTFTHFELEITPLRVQAVETAGIMDSPMQWYAPDALPGVPAPIKRIIDQQQEIAET